MSEARIDASVKMNEDASLSDAQELQRAIHEVFIDHGAQGQVAIVYDTRDHDPHQFPFGGAGGAGQMIQQPQPQQVDGDPESAGQYL